MKLTAAQFAKKVKVPRTSISRLCRKGDLPAELVSSGPVPYYLIDASEAKRFVKRGAGKPRKKIADG